MVFTVASLPQVMFAETNVNSVVFLNADTNEAINEIGTAQKVKAEVSFTVQKEGTVNVITACYNETGRMLESLLVEPLSFGAEDVNQVAEYETATLSVTSAQKIKVFIWEEDTYYPTLKHNGILVKAFDTEIYSENNNFEKKMSAENYETEENAYVILTGKTAKAGDIFAALSDTQINSKYFDVTAEKVSDTEVSADFAADTSDWTKGTLTFEGVGLVKLTAQDYDFCVPTEAYVNVIEPRDTYGIAFENIDKYIYRVGNKNSVKLGNLFTANEELMGENLSVGFKVTKGNGNVSGTYTENSSNWADGTIKFSGTGIISITITDEYSNPVHLLVEVVNGTNATSYSDIKSGTTVMLNDITMTAGGKLFLTNSVLYGNGFVLDVSQGSIKGGYISENYLVSLNNSTLDNVQIVGAVYTEYGPQASNDYNNPTVLATGDCVITNCYISNCAAPVRVNNADLTITDSTLKGGNFANLDIRNGNVTLEDVTTINQADSNDLASDGKPVVGLGIVVYLEQVLDTTKVNVVGSLTQYNELSKADDKQYIRNDAGQNLFDGLFSNNNLVYSVDGSDYVNAGIISMTPEVVNANITDVSGYGHNETISYMGKKGYMHAPISSLGDAPAYETKGQGVIAPQYSFDYTTKNYIAKTEGSNKFCYYNDGSVLISFDDGDSFEWDPEILTVTKFGDTLSYTVAMNGIDYTGKKITFTETGDHTVTYTYTDTKNYCLDEDVNVVTFSESYTKTVNLNVTAVKPEAKHAEFTFGSNGVSARTVTIGNETYVMPDVNATSDTIGSTTVNGTTVYYPIVSAYTSDGKTAHGSVNFWNMCFPVFKDVVTITDYQNEGLGDAVTYNGSTQALPSGLSVPAGPGTVFKYQASNDAPSEPAVHNSVLVYKSPTLSNNARKALSVTAKYKYEDNAGSIYYYYVRYDCPETTEKDSGCVTGDTLVTLADGSYKRIDEVTYSDKLLVWNFYEGRYEEVASAIIFNHGYDNNTVIKLKFDDGTEVKAVNLHQFFCSEDNKFVTITEDNVADYLNKSFVKKNGNGYKTVKLTDYEISKEYVEAYGIISATHYNILVQNMFSTDFMEEDYDLFNYFEVGENMMFDAGKLAKDAETYGTYSYDDFKDYVTKDQFEAFNIKYMKVSVGKGYYTFEGILNLIEEYLNVN